MAGLARRISSFGTNLTIENTYVSHVTSYRDIDSIADYKDVTYDDQGNVAEIKYYVNEGLALHNTYTDNVLTRAESYHLHSGSKAWDVGYHDNGTVKSLYTWDLNVIPLVSFLAIENGMVTEGTVFYPGTRQAIISLQSLTADRCYDKNGVLITCTAEHTALLDIDRYINPPITKAQETWYDAHGNIEQIKLYYKGVLELHNTYTDNVLTRAESYHLHSGSKAWDVGYHDNGTVKSLYTWDLNVIPLVSFLAIENGMVTEGTVFYPGTRQAIISLQSLTADRCYDKNGVLITCTAEHTALLDIDRYPH